MASSSSSPLILSLLLLSINTVSSASTWCVARSDAGIPALQTALDYACGSGADCIPLQADGLCFLPNTIQAHASYAFNSYYQRKGMAPGSCDFSGYGSCVYPSSLSTAGGTSPATASSNNPTTMTPATTNTPVFGNGLTPGMTPTIPDNVDNSRASSSDPTMTTIFATITILLVLTIALNPSYVFSY
ncbi:hypothetical protein G4B88_004854 [Cannabis sativa]|uniref:X8 domain-containing protein n=1 Tax=Cannabis sativa TaxID=3483 RepID=A0A7J6FVE7_CANSA|nr:hypothetical protein G4B88_004854 [Cannabis sativa]